MLRRLSITLALRDVQHSVAEIFLKQFAKKNYKNIATITKTLNLLIISFEIADAATLFYIVPKEWGSNELHQLCCDHKGNKHDHLQEIFYKTGRTSVQLLVQPFAIKYGMMIVCCSKCTQIRELAGCFSVKNNCKMAGSALLSHLNTAIATTVPGVFPACFDGEATSRPLSSASLHCIDNNWYSHIIIEI